MLCSTAGSGSRMGAHFYQLQAPKALPVACLEWQSVSQLTGNGMRYNRTTGYSSKTPLRMLRRPSNLSRPPVPRNFSPQQRLQLLGFSLASCILVMLLLSFIPRSVNGPCIHFTVLIWTSCSLNLTHPAPSAPHRTFPPYQEHCHFPQRAEHGGVMPQCPF